MLNRPCDKCGESFAPTGSSCKVCDVCRNKSTALRNARLRLNNRMNRLYEN